MAITIQLLIIIFFLFFVNVILIKKDKWEIAFGIFLFLLLFIPVEIQGVISGKLYSTAGYLNLSIAGYDALILLFCTAISKKKKNYKRLNVKNIYSIIILLFIMFFIRALRDGLGFISNKIFDNYFLPIILSLLAINFLSKNQMKTVLKTFYVMVFINSIVACFEFFIGKSIFFHEYYLQNINWYKTIYKGTQYGVTFRSTSFLGHPLTNGLYYVIASIYCLNKKSKLKTVDVIQLFILMLAIFTTNSRTCIFMFLIYLCFWIFKNKKYNLIFLLLSLLLLFIFSEIIDFSNLYMTIFKRDASGSSFSVRVHALQTFFTIPISTLFFGTGYNNTAGVLSMLKFTGNLEISYLIIMLENGLIGFFCWISILLNFFKNNKNIKNNMKFSLKHMCIMLFIIVATSNSIGDPGTLNYTLFLLLGLNYIVNEKEERENE